jgi:hypothetical protein
MKRLATTLFIAAAVFALASDPVVVTITQLNNKPADYHKKDVTTSGKVLKFSNKTSQAGNEYFKFDITEGARGKELKAVRIYGMGKIDPPLKDGARVTVTGEFTQEKVVSGRTYKMEIEVKPKNVKLASAEAE